MEKESIEISEQLFNDFVTSASGFISDIKRIVYTNKEDSSIAKKINGKNVSCSVLTVYVKSLTYYKNLNLDSRMGNWDDAFIYSLEIKNIWNNLMDKYSLVDNTNTKIEYLFFKCSDLQNIIEAVYSSKDDIFSKIISQQLPKPDYIFANSMPGYSIILHNKKDYQEYKNYGIIKIKEDILSILSVKVAYITSESLNIFIYHMKMKGLNLYGLSRED